MLTNFRRENGAGDSLSTVVSFAAPDFMETATELRPDGVTTLQDYVVWFDSLGMDDIENVGGKNASLGEMISNLANAGVQVPGGFATTAAAFWDFLDQSGLREKINTELASLDVDDVDALTRTGTKIRQMIVDTPYQPKLRDAIAQAYERLEAESAGEGSYAVRSSATAEDLPDASFAGQQETYLNVRGLDSILEAVHHVFASLYNDRAIA